MLTGSEKEDNIIEGLKALRDWGENNGYVFPKVQYLLSDLARSFINAFFNVFGDLYSEDTLPWVFCSWHNLRAVKKKINDLKFDNSFSNLIKKI